MRANPLDEEVRDRKTPAKKEGGLRGRRDE